MKWQGLLPGQNVRDNSKRGLERVNWRDKNAKMLASKLKA